MKAAKPEEVTESVTMVAPGILSSRMALIRAMSRLRLISRPLLSTMAARSQSVSKIRPRSAPAFSTARLTESMAWGFSGLGM